MMITAVAAMAAVAGTTVLGGAAAAAPTAHTAQVKDIGDVTYTDFLGGRVVFTQTETSTVRMTGQFNDGFDDPEASCLLHVGDFAPLDLRGDLDGSINPPGTSPFQFDFTDVTIDDFTGVPVRVICDNEVIAVSDPTIPV
ncbi:hypothetical protein [Streptomyces cucumeris]|uniref:hypothetical protein n=1 Tax=Streptomyces cucumeris TaxID=2962890 RepID=UPI003EB73BCC